MLKAKHILKARLLRLAPICLAIISIAACVPAPTALVGGLDKATSPTATDMRSADGSTSPDKGSESGPENANTQLISRLDAILSVARDARSMDTTVNAAWQIMHGVVCFGSDLQVDTPDRGRISALSYAFSGGAIRGLEMMPGDVLPATGRRGVKAKLEPGSYIGQGHVDQWIAICAMSNIPANTPIQLGDATFTVEDWARQAQYDVSENYLDEYGWTLIALTHYLPEETTWTSRDGQQYSIEDLVGSEVGQELSEAACGGTHRMAGIVRAVNLKRERDLPDSATWSAAEQLVQQCIANAKQNRASDGRLSCYYFDRSGVTSDLSVELSSAGHVFEFLALAVGDEEIASPWMQRVCGRLCEILEATATIDMECGGLYHALNGLKIYRQRLSNL